ncbi:hypothetical protein PIB30_051249 [Stylosanthes scabra]|uniref:Leucine-rich repeat domain, L domain-containing protein n=1 Tax=Stylosanthes scabra TaxID=79078 RepID=A0ABU6YGN4_9FABA|nr:hypothetical protein [Stylosanthes scabra]
MQHQQHHSLHTLLISNSCDSLTSLAFPAFPNLNNLAILRHENLTSLEVSQLQYLQYLFIHGCPKLQSIRVPASLSLLFISECPLLGEGIERKDPLIWPSISHISTIFVDGKWMIFKIPHLENSKKQIGASWSKHNIWRAKEPGQE